MRDSTVDERFMRHALDLAMRGAGLVSPNPLVGALIVSGQRIVGEGYHSAFGGPHAEREALTDCLAREEDPVGATVYVTLEPCCHTGHTPPCTDALIEAKVARVVVGATDPNPQVAGKGISALREAGIEVVEGVLEDACAHINEAFFHYILTEQPLVVAKYAMTLDGRIATKAGFSKWITGVEARKRVHEDRQRFAAIMVGVGTVIADDPILSYHLDEFRDAEESNTFDVDEQENSDKRMALGPVRIICDSHLRTPLCARVVTTAQEIPTIIATCVEDEAAHEPYCACGCGIMVVDADDQGHVDLVRLIEKLAERGINGVIIEGGATLLGASFDAGIVDKVHAYIAPKIFGGSVAISPVAGKGVVCVDDAVRLHEPKVVRLGDDLLLECGVM